MNAHFAFQITSVAPKIAGLQEVLPKSIGLLPFDGGIAGKKGLTVQILCTRIFCAYHFFFFVLHDLYFIPPHKLLHLLKTYY